jgi:ATP-dependent helicase/nuclease subunit A
MPATLSQKQAADPNLSIWLSANAGTGKTKVLVDRLMRLIIEGHDPRKIICITFTQAAASEMQNRVIKKFSQMMLYSDQEIIEAYRDLTSKDGDPKQVDLEKLRNAKKVFTSVMDNPDQLKIQTIHSICKSILYKFPLEAQVPPFFEVIDEISKDEIFMEVWVKIISNFMTSDNNESLEQDGNVESRKYGDIASDLLILLSRFKESDITDKLKECFGIKSKIMDIIEKHGSKEDYYKALKKECGIGDYNNKEEVKTQFYFRNINDAKLLAKYKIKGTSADFLQKYIETKKFDILEDNLTTTLGGVRKSFIAVTDIKDKDEKDHIKDVEKIFLSQLEEKINMLKSFENLKISKAFTNILLHISDKFDEVKKHHGYLDYDDLISKTARLLQKSDIKDWVLYRLDGGIDHILLDEAQDTNPEQWSIIEALSESYFSETYEDSKRNKTLFVVGDEKQSIYRFQGADIDNYELKKYKYLKLAYDNPEIKFEKVELEKSFRSSKAILQFVDELSRDEEIKSSISKTSENIKHEAFLDNFGAVKLYPLIEGDKVENTKKDNDLFPSWKLQQQELEGEEEGAKKKLAKEISAKINEIISNNTPILSEGSKRSAESKDFIILVRKRNEIFRYLTEELQKLNIPVSGLDRLDLKKDMTVMDLLSLAKFKLLANDDLNLACLLKSPIFEFDDQDLLDLCFDRGDLSLFDQLKQNRNKSSKFSKANDILTDILYDSESESVCDFFYHALEKLRFRDKFIKYEGYNQNEIIDQFLQLCIDFEDSYQSSLQDFIIWFENNKFEIKRDLEGEDNNQVRIMTIHGSKGLEAPYIFIADTTSGNSTRYGFEINEDMFLFAGSKSFASDLFLKLMKEREKKELEEYYRLLYVALTRAKDELHIFGFKNKKGNEINKPQIWYNKLTETFKRLPEENITTDDNGVISFTSQEYSAQLKEVNPERSSNKDVEITSLPEYLKEKYQLAENLEYLTPNELNKQTSFDVKSKTISENQDEITKGILIHRILEKLPEYNEEQYEDVLKIIFKEHESIEKEFREEIKDEALKTIKNPDFEFIFSNNSYSEVPVSGYVNDGQFVSGIIDKLVIGKDKIWIIDFKTTSNLNDNEEAKALNYKRQMDCYETLIAKIYPDTKIEKAILFTNTQKLVSV